MAVKSNLLILFLWIMKLVSAQNPCYDKNKPVRCEPPFSNVAYNLKTIEATNTCGERVINDATGRPYPPQKIESFQTFYQQTGAAGATKYKDFCDANSANLAKRHPPRSMVDLDGNDNRTWWQSITLYEYKERGLGDMVQSTIALHLGKAFDITYIRLKFHSSRPESFAIYKRTSQNNTWEPYQFYSASCRSTYNLPQNGIIDTPTRAVCTGEYSDISPLSGGNVAFSTLEGRPYAYEFDKNKLLQEFVTATDIKVELTRLNTFGDEVFEDTQVLQSYFYAISDISIGGRCKCNGHASECVPSLSERGEERKVCLCQHNTTGADCEKCLPFYNNKPWAPATLLNANPCEQCNCNGRSEVCYFDQALYDRTGNGGHCRDCRDFTDGPSCERCKQNFFRTDPRDVCSPCNCNEIGSTSLQCDSSGQCRCKPGVTGPKCDRCQANYYDFGIYGCRDCKCMEAGSFDNKPYCDSRTGQCSCKEYVEGQNCGQCKPGYFNLDVSSRFGCIACFCNGKTSQCSSATGYKRSFINSFFDSGKEGWAGKLRDDRDYTIIFTELTENLGVSADGSGDVYFSAPSRFLGNQQYSYNQFLEFALRIGEEQGRPSQRDVILEGNGRQVYIPIFAQNNSAPGIKPKSYKFRLNENPLYQWTPTLSALEFQRLLANLTSIKIRGSYNPTGRGFIDDIKLHTAQNGQQLGDISTVESCVCPPQYIGQHCESCAPGYRRLMPFGGPNSDCVPCDCNGHSDTCDAESGACICMHNTEGHNCEKCKEGFYGNAMTGTAADCRPCPCPGQGKCFEQVDFTVSCLNCPFGYDGDLCDMCTDGFYGDPIGRHGVIANCSECMCNGNVDSNAVGYCDNINGLCKKCIYNTTGDHCESCLPGFYGDAIGPVKGDCKLCQCNTYGTVPSMLSVCNQTNGQCSCLPYVRGRQCDRCEDGYFNLESAGGCEACLCDPIGSLNTTCHLKTGQCECKPGIGGLRCDVCIADYFGFSSSGCVACNCSGLGSAHGQCDPSGQCQCKDESRITGLHCDECRENKFNLTAGCLDCPHCYNLVQDAANAIRKGLLDLAMTLQNIDKNPNIADDEDFNNQLGDLSKQINDLHEQYLQNSAGTLPEEISAIFKDLEKMQKAAEQIAEVIDSSEQKFNNINLNLVNSRVANLTTDINTARSRFANESAELYRKISEALNIHGQKSDNMTALSQQSSVIADRHEALASEIELLSDDANELSDLAYQKALDVVKSPQDLKEKLTELASRLSKGESLLSEVRKASQAALTNASMVYNTSISLYTRASQIEVPDTDSSVYITEAGATLKEAEAKQLEAIELQNLYNSLLNESNALLKKAEAAYNSSYTEQTVTDALMAEVDVALDLAQKARKDAEGMLADAKERLKTLQEFDERVKDHKDKAKEAMKNIEVIEQVLDSADNETRKAVDAINGAHTAADEAERIAVKAQATAIEAGKAAAKILEETKNTRKAAGDKVDKVDKLDDSLKNLDRHINELDPKVAAEQDLINMVLSQAESAKKIAENNTKMLAAAKAQVDEIIDKLGKVPDLDTTELDQLEERIAVLEEFYASSNIDKHVKDLEMFRNVQVTLANQHVSQLSQLEKDVNNIKIIVDTIPTGCYTKQELEKSVDPMRKRKRQRKYRK